MILLSKRTQLHLEWIDETMNRCKYNTIVVFNIVSRLFIKKKLTFKNFYIKMKNLKLSSQIIYQLK